MLREFPLYFFILVFVVLEEVNALWYGTVDHALILVGTSIFPNPYGLFWTWTNPFFQEFTLYKLYLVGFVVALAGIQYWMWKKKKFPFVLIILNHLQNTAWFFTGGYQHITMTAWQFLAFYNPFFIGLWIFSEIPFGNPAGWSCDFGSVKTAYTLYGGQYQLCGPGLFFGSNGLIMWHFMELFWCFAPGIYWFVWRWKIPQKVWKYLRQRLDGFYSAEGEHWNVGQ